MYFSVVCAEDVWRASDAEIARATAGTIAGDYWHRQLAGAWKVWPHATSQLTVAKTFRSRVPALIVSGPFDPSRRPRMGALMAKNLVNSRHIVIANASRSFARLDGCVDVIMAKFVRDPDPGRVDESCAAAIAPPRFK
jgi:pimeloyl-ACP methyl ester carboxylesterase